MDPTELNAEYVMYQIFAVGHRWCWRAGSKIVSAATDVAQTSTIMRSSCIHEWECYCFALMMQIKTNYFIKLQESSWAVG